MNTLSDLLTLEELAADRFRCLSMISDEKRVFGGQLLCQALLAAGRTAPNVSCNSLHVLFVGPGEASKPFEIDVTRIRDGRSFASRQVTVRQSDKLILSAMASFHRGDDGPEHELNALEVPRPEDLKDQREVRHANAAANGKAARTYSAETMLDARPFEMPVDESAGVEGRRCLWIRSRAPLADEPILHQAAIAYASDMGMVNVSLRPHIAYGDGRPIDFASLDHALWFHRPARADEWLLCVQRSPAAVAGRGLAFSHIYTREGALVATCAQESLVRFARERLG